MKKIILFFLLFCSLQYLSVASDFSITKKYSLRNAHRDAISSISFSQNDLGLITFCVDGTIQLWDLGNDGKPNRVNFNLPLPKQNILFGTEFVSERNLFPIISQGLIKILTFDQVSINTDQILRPEDGAVLTSIKISPNGNFTALGFANGATQIYDTKTGKISYTKKNHRSDITTLSYSHGENYLISGDDDGKLWVINVNTGNEEYGILRGTAPVFAAAMAKDGKIIVSCSADNVLRIWDSETKKEIKSFNSASWNASLMKLSPDETIVAHLANDTTIQFIDLKDYHTEEISFPEFISAFAFSHSGNSFAVTNMDGDWSMWNVSGIESQPTKEIPPDFRILTPVLTMDTRGMKSVTITGAQSLAINGVFGNMFEVDSIVVNKKKAILKTVKDNEKNQYQMKHKNVYYFSSTDSFPVGQNRIVLTAYRSGRVTAAENFAIVIEQPKKKEPSPPTTDRKIDIHAFIIGLSEYEEKAYNLKYAAADAMFFDKKISDPSMGGALRSNITYLINENATRIKILDKLENRLKSTLPGDLVLIYFACHGFAEDGEVYYMAYDTDPNKLRATGVRSQDIIDYVVKFGKDRKIIMFYDACNSGVTGEQLATRGAFSAEEVNAFYQEISKENNFIITLTASNKGEFSHEGEEYGGGHGVFTYFLGMGLSGAANADLDQYITIGELYNFVRRKVREATDDKQSPTINYSQSSGSIPLDIPLAIVR